jgi:hypothetical protein
VTRARPLGTGPVTVVTCLGRMSIGNRTANRLASTSGRVSDGSKNASSTQSAAS